MAGGKALDVARLEIEEIDLEERVALLPLTLENQPGSVRTEVALSRPFPGERQLTGAGQEPGLVPGRIFGGFVAENCRREGKKSENQSGAHIQ